ncbi:hypothetical protein Ndes2526B_g06484 [Nannochloris sp. 'desiccata']|nr:hypothetical protein KSW81_008234 [Chlorella desiccata (nom. nud.)]KAH7619503.1 putative Tubulin-folding cofactor A [Chlorella desiccata (nom. nud.)]
MAEVRNLGIKTGSVRRLGKEMVMYREEEQREQAKVQKMKANNADQYDLKHAENVLAESVAMVHDTHQRLKTAVKELEEFMEENTLLISQAPEFQAAKEEVEKATALL